MAQRASAGKAVEKQTRASGCGRHQSPRDG
jgi:hypothetical protein